MISPGAIAPLEGIWESAVPVPDAPKDGKHEFEKPGM